MLKRSLLILSFAVGMVSIVGIHNATAQTSTQSVPQNMSAPGVGGQEIQGGGGSYYLIEGGHIGSIAGPTPLPTVGTGTVTAGGTDSAMEVTGGTSPVTVTFQQAFRNKPICVCNDETSALGACKAVPNSNGATVVVTTTGTDSFMLICIAK